MPDAIPSDMDAIVLRALAKKPEARFADGRALADALAGSSVAGKWKPAHVAELPRPRPTPTAIEPTPSTESDTRVEVRPRSGEGDKKRVR
jgi:hypothetical protein